MAIIFKPAVTVVCYAKRHGFQTYRNVALQLSDGDRSKHLAWPRGLACTGAEASGQSIDTGKIVQTRHAIPDR